MHFTPAFISTITLASVCMGAAVDKRKSWLFSCGCDGQSDANANDCRAAIDQIDVNANVMDPMNAISVVHTGPLSSASIMYQSGDCALAIGNTQNINGPGGIGGGTTGTTISGADFKDLMTQLMGCEDTANGLINACASVGAGNAMIFKH
ncbi:Uncharacterized protein PECH_005951 [Penicillium ucsense]|uniref:Uncharacterized protein n=1 Tax=Penicillium ucsense TaxID=2839758 RepID=A0A8J8W5B3_9EURO|nr:Uncharacterized protein PECM_002153 [Penicillium ucsense]KAF7736021.1 Uncharacterized protein PECH_005951 [Penicillium ucsense]